MKTPLARLVEAPNRRRGIILPAIEPTRVLESELLAIYNKPLAIWIHGINNEIMPEYSKTMALRDSGIVSDSADTLSMSIQNVKNRALHAVAVLSPTLAKWVERANRWHATKWTKAVATAAPASMSEKIWASIRTPRVVEALQASLNRNIELITSVSDDMAKRISEIIWNAYNTRKPRVDVTKEIRESVQIPKNRAIVIARDQTTKLGASLDRERQQELGIDKFKWRHSGKVHFRPEHKARDGNIYEWDNNDLNGDLPGIAINCGCKAQAYIELGG